MCLQKCVTGYPQCPLQARISNLPEHCLLGQGFPCCFLRALSQMAGLRWTLSPLGSAHLIEHTSTPKQDFLRMCTLWLLVLLIAQPEACLLASSLVAGYTSLQWPSAHSSHRLYSLTLGILVSLMSQSVPRGLPLSRLLLPTTALFTFRYISDYLLPFIWKHTVNRGNFLPVRVTLYHFIKARYSIYCNILVLLEE